MSNYALLARLTLKPGAGEAFDALAREVGAEVRAKEPGVLIYLCHTVEGVPDQRLYYELYADHETFEAHQLQPHTQRLLAEMPQYVAHAEVDRLTPFTGNPSGAPR